METILVPTDFSDAANNALDYAVELSQFFDSKIILLNANLLPVSAHESSLAVEVMRNMENKAKEELENLKNRALAKPHRKLSIEYYTEIDYPYEAIENAVKKFNIDLVVMGITGEAGKIKEHIIGSTAVKVARKIEVPVFIIPEKVKYKTIKRISFACDLEKMEKSALVYIVKYFNKLFDAELEVVHVEKPEEEVTVERSRSSTFIEKKLENTRHRMTFVTHTEVGHGLRDYFRVHPTDLVMLNPKKHSIFHNLFHESVTKELAFHLELPILAIH